MRAAIEKVRSQLGREYPLVIGGERIKTEGKLESINPASGAVFALIPPQNATGNWVKVVQRIPVRIAIDGPPNAPILRDGMSANVTIDTGHRRSLSTLWLDIRGLL